jgi:hypothetical protein
MRRIASPVVAALLALSVVAPAASAQDEWPPPNFVAPCMSFDGWVADAGQPIHFVCGWGIQGGPGLLVSYLNSYRATLVVSDDAGNVVLTIDPEELASLWGDPQVGDGDTEDVDCAGPTGRAVYWHYWLEAGLPAGSYTVSFTETLRHPVNDGYHTCWLRVDGSRLVPPPSLYRGSWEDIGTLTVMP